WTVAAFADGATSSGSLAFTVRAGHTLYRVANGAPVGTVAVSGTAGVTSLSVRLQALRPNTTYMVYDCMSNPLNNPNQIPGMLCLTTVSDAVSLTSDDAGNASGIIAFAGILPVNYVVIVNTND